MSGRILQINFKYHDVSAGEFEDFVNPMADPIAGVEGLRWKIMMHNEETAEAGGIYLFDNANAVESFLAGPLVEQIVNSPALSDFSVKQFGIMKGFTAKTRGPVEQLSAA